MPNPNFSKFFNKRISTPVGIFIIVLVAIIAGGIMVWQTEWIILQEEVAKESNDSFYYIQLTRKPETPEPEPYLFDFEWGVSCLGDYLIDALDISFPLKRHDYLDIISVIAFDTRDNVPLSKFDRNYYIVLKHEKGVIETDKIYHHKSFFIKVSKADEKLLPYITNSDYCTVDSDCVIRYNFCDYGSFNYYHHFVDGYGCENVYYPEENENELWSASRCDPQTQSPVVEYKSSKCINHQCIAYNRTLSCGEPAP